MAQLSNQHTQVHESYASTVSLKVGTDRSFGLIMGIALFIIAYLPVLKGEPFREWALYPGLFFLLLAWGAPQVLHPLNVAWFRLGIQLSKVTTPLVMGVLFYGVITPFGMALKAAGKDLLALKADKSQQSYWIHRTPPGPPPEKMAKPY